MRQRPLLVSLLALASVSCSGGGVDPHEVPTATLAGTWIAQSFAFLGLTDSLRLTLTVTEAEVTGTGVRWINDLAPVPFQFHGRISPVEVAGERWVPTEDSIYIRRDSLWLVPSGARLYGQIARSSSERILASVFELVRIPR
ncbi:MAG: hypothetical protein U0132_16865 [Gemmatimonadaceae bacterium]